MLEKEVADIRAAAGDDLLEATFMELLLRVRADEEAIIEADAYAFFRILAAICPDESRAFLRGMQIALKEIIKERYENG